MVDMEACTAGLKEWLSQSENLWNIKNSLSANLYTFDDPDVTKRSINFATVYYWATFRHSRTACLKSDTLKQMFLFIELAPLLCVLDDFLEQLDSFCHEQSTDTANNAPSTEQKQPEQSKESSDGSNVNKKCTGFATSTEMGYVEGLELYCLLKCRLLDLRHNWKLVQDQSVPRCKDFMDVHRSLILEKLQSLIDTVNSIIMTGFHSEEYSPRFDRMCSKLELTAKEREAMMYIFVHNGGVLFAKLYNRFSDPNPAASSSVISSSRTNSMALGAVHFAGMNGKEMHEFFSEDRLHLKQELFRAEDEFSSLMTSSFLQMSPTVTKACCGGVLSAEETYKIDKTALAEVLLDEQSVKAPDVKNVKSQSVADEGDKETKKQDEGPETLEGDENTKGEEDDSSVNSLELEDILRACTDIQQTVTGQKEGKGDDETTQDEESSQVYKHDLEYLEDNFKLIETLVKARKTESNDDAIILRSDQRRPEAVIREMKAKARSLKTKIAKKMEATKLAGDWLPRLERLADLRRLNEFEKNVLLFLTGCMVSRNLRNSGGSHDDIFRHHINVGMLIGLFCEGLEEQIKARIYFYQNSTLIKEGLVHVSDPFLSSRGNFLESGVELDRRLLDYIVGLDTEINEVINGSDLYSPDTELNDVALPPAQRERILSAFDSFLKFKKTCKELKLNTRGTSKGLCMLFYGPSGTGKTMTANAVAKYLNKKILLVTVSLLSEIQISKFQDLLRFIFREAKIHNAIVFFDECEPIFETRDNRPNVSLALMLTEIEQYDDIIILATNRHQDLDEAMHRRIQLALPFSIPDYTLRMKIWESHVPVQLLDSQINWEALAQSFELTGGLIRNAVLSAISLATKNTVGNDQIKLCQDDLHNGAKLQLRDLLEMVDFERRVIPTFGLEEVLLEPSITKTVDSIINTGKTHKFITSQWGFSSSSNNENVAQAGGVVCLLCGPAGVGKTAVAHGIAYELGQPIKEANCSELLSHTVSTNPRASKGIATFFRDAQKANAIVVLDGAEFVFGSVSGTLVSGIIGCETYSLAYQIERYPGMVILTSRQDIGMMDISRVPHLRYIVPLREPSVGLRKKLWEKLLPKKVPKSAKGIDFVSLAETYSINGGQIAAVICSAAEKAVGSSNNGSDGAKPCVVTTELLCQSAEEVLSLQESGRIHQYSLFQ